MKIKILFNESSQTWLNILGPTAPLLFEVAERSFHLRLTREKPHDSRPKLILQWFIEPEGAIQVISPRRQFKGKIKRPRGITKLHLLLHDMIQDQ